MSPWLLYIVMVLYAGVTIQYVYAGRWGMALVFFGYSIANVGFAWDAR